MFSLHILYDIYNSDNPEKKIWNLFSNPIIRESIYLGSPDLFDRLELLEKEQLSDSIEKRKLVLPLLKYITRLSSRSTPFGLFSGTSVGQFSDLTELVLKPKSEYIRHTRLDFEVLSQLARTMSENDIQSSLISFYPNTTLYKCANEFRYIRVAINEGTKEYILQRIHPNRLMESVLSFTERGKKSIELIEHIVQKGFKKDEAHGFITELISAQIIVNNTEPYTVGEDYHEFLLSLMSEQSSYSIYNALKVYQEQLNSLDKTFGNDPKLYKNNIGLLKNIIPSIKREHLFQVDLYPQYHKTTLNKKIKIDISKALNILSKLFEPYESDEMKEFVSAYESRYEQQPIPLVQALDLDYGIGYPINKNKAVYPYLNDLPNESLNIGSKGITLNKTELFLSGLIQKTNDKIIDLSSVDLEQFELKDPNLNATFFSMGELFIENDKTHIYLEGFAGSSVSNLLGRFTNGSEETKTLVENIMSFENDFHQDHIVAEIAHLPEDRTGNILFHPQMRKFKINFLSGANMDQNEDIGINDLILGIENSKLVLKSKRLNKKIFPYLSNAHNHNLSKLPIYSFLCDYQYHHYSGKVGFYWGNLTKIYDFLPRITFNTIVLSKARWIFESSFIYSIFKKEHTDTQLLQASKDLCSVKKLPNIVQFKQGDNVLLVNLSSPISIRMFRNALPKDENSKIILLEYLQEKGNVVQNEEEKPFANEFIFCLTNTKT